MIRRTLLGLALFLSACTLLTAQATTVFTDAYRSFKEGEKHFNQGLYALAQSEFDRTLNLLRPLNEPDAELLRAQAELNYARAAVQLEQPDGEKLILDFVRRYQPDPIANRALAEVASFYFNAGKYDQAAQYFDRIPLNSLSREERARIAFQSGYSYFVSKDFARAKTRFQETKDIDGEYYYPTNYYLGLIYFFDGDYDKAVQLFRIVERSPSYDSYIPYYLAQIYFAQARYDELIAYAEPRLAQRGIKNDKEIRQLIGQAYFEKQDYARALPYLEEYAAQSRSLREDELYQLGFTQYQTGSYAKAAETFQEVSTANSAVGQSANYYLGDARLRAGDRTSARYAFGNAMRMNFDPVLQEEATYNYAKLSYELRDPREAINALQMLQPSSRYYVESQRLLGEIFLTYRDYEQALSVLDKTPNKTPELREAYQRVSFLRGLQLMQEGNTAEAKRLLNQSLATPLNASYRAQALYWLGDIANREENYPQSVNYINQFLTIAQTVGPLPAQSSIYSGNYLQGYNYLKQDNYAAALDYFRATVEGIERNAAYITDAQVRERVLGDAVLRAGDAYFKRNQYPQAVQYYDQAVRNQYSGFIYALYQKAIIEGLRGRNGEKLLALEQIANQYPRSEYADDALFQTGLTYQTLNQLPNAVAPFRKIIENYKTSSPLVNESLIQLGLVSYNLGNQEGAVNYYKQIFGNNPTASEANRALSALEEIYVRDMGRADLYFAFLETVPGYKVDNASRDNINFQAAESQFENANYTRAIEEYTKYIRMYPNGQNTLTAYYHRGESYAVNRQYAQALADYEFVVSRGPSAFYLRALEKGAIIAYNSEQDFAKAYQLYSQLEQAADNSGLRFEAQLGAMRAAYRSGNTGAVQTQAAKVANNPSATPAQRSTANFYLAKIAFDQQRYDQALPTLDQVIANSDNETTAEARYLRNYIYYQRRDLARAQELALATNRENSGYPFWVAKNVILLADILRERKDLYNARAALQALLENYNEDQTLVQEARQKLARLETEINQGSRLNNSPTNTSRGFIEMDNGG